MFIGCGQYIQSINTLYIKYLKNKGKKTVSCRCLFNLFLILARYNKDKARDVVITAVKEVNIMKRKSIAMLAAAICTLAITITAFAADFISAEQARSIAAQWVPAGSTHLVTKDEGLEFIPHYDVKFYDNKTNTAYEVEVLKNGGKVREFKMEAKTVIGSPKIVLSANDVQNLVRKEFPNAVFTKVDLDRDKGLYEYELDFYTAEVRGEMKFNPETGAVLEKEIKYNVH